MKEGYDCLERADFAIASDDRSVFTYEALHSLGSAIVPAHCLGVLRHIR